ncbi:MAG: hypothetical protein ACLSGK_15620 [Lachnospiraceae bacterium]
MTTTSEKYSTSFGFTEEEVLRHWKMQEIPEEKEHVRYWYDGFSFGNRKGHL